MDIRVIPHPADLPVISEPGMFVGWILTVESYGVPHSVLIEKHLSNAEVAACLRTLANKLSVEADDD